MVCTSFLKVIGCYYVAIGLLELYWLRKKWSIMLQWSRKHWRL